MRSISPTTKESQGGLPVVWALQIWSLIGWVPEPVDPFMSCINLVRE